MKLRLLLPIVLLSLALPALSQKTATYVVTDLGTLPGGNFAQATFITNNGLIGGLSNVADGSQHAFLYSRGSLTDISTPGLGGTNAGAFGGNEMEVVMGIAENSTFDPNQENFCDYWTGLECIPVFWRSGVMNPLPLLGGNNGTLGNRVSNSGLIPGAAETSTRDPQCPTGIAVNGTGPQVLDYKPVLWNTSGGIRQLRLPPGDTVGVAYWANDAGQAVGTTGTCDNTVVPPFAIGPHAVIWNADGSVHDLGNLGGTANPNALGAGNVAFAINNKSQVTGVSALPGSTTIHAFLWTAGVMQDLGTYPGDNMSGGLAMNNTGDVVGASISGPDPLSGSPRAVIWHNGQVADLNALVPADTPFYMLTAFGISDSGQIIGFGLDFNTFEIHGFLATPVAGSSAAARGPMKPAAVPSSVKHQLRRYLP